MEKNMEKYSSSSGADVEELAVRRPHKVYGTALLALSFQTLGIIYSDIGTSPLYVLNGIWPSSEPPPSTEDVIGGVSAIVWSLTLLPLLKYVIIGLRFGTAEGEGGTFALFHGIFPPKHVDYEGERALTTDSGWKTPSNTSSIKTVLDKFRWPLISWALFGTALTFADGMLTPAVSVTSAVGGIALTRPMLIPNINNISVGFIVALFLIQRFGTAKVSMIFSPVTFVWLLLLLVTGIYNIVSYPGIFRSFDPSRAIMWFVRTKHYDVLAGVLLAVTGCEAMFANLGQFNRLSIQLSFACFTYPALIFAYLGQGAKLITDGETVIQNVFYSSIPGGAGKPLYWIVYVFAILATLVASQATITATFSLFQQVINLRSLPPVRMRHTSDTVQGQIYIPSVNWLLCAGTIIFVLVFKDLAQLTNAYGFAVATVMFVTTTLITIQIPYVKRKPWILAIVWFIFFGFFDGLFWGAAFRKLEHGAWVPFMIGLILTIFMVFWTWARGLEDYFDGANRRNLRHFISKEITERLLSDPKSQRLSTSGPSSPTSGVVEIGGTQFQRLQTEQLEEPETIEDLHLYLDTGDSKVELPRMATMAIFHKLSSGKGVPHTFYGFLKQWPALPRVVVFLSVRIMPIAHVEKENRYRITKVRSLPGFYGATYMKGFRDDFNVDINAITELIAYLELRATDSKAEAEEIIKEIKFAAKNATHIVPHYHVMARRVIMFGAPIWNWFRRILIEDVYRSIAYMFPETVTWLTAADEIIHVGVTAEI
ncbi:potassium transporter [Serendipita vermifera]|nr:potassium transporter [Serendipita vermifera]